jgi:hypothetical protein
MNPIRETITMFLRHASSTKLFWSLLVLLVFASSGRAQYWFRYPGGFHPGYGGYGGYGNQYAGRGGYLHGTADIISATGDLMIKNQQAYTEQEKAKQERYVTKRKAFDEMMYEKANTPTYTEELLYKKKLLLHRMMTNPTQGEIVRGDTLNAMMPLLQDLAAKGVPGPPVQIDPDLLQHINVTIKGTASAPNLGMLKNPSELDWPLPLQSPEQEKLAASINTVVSDAVSGKLKGATYRELTSELTKFEADWRKKFLKEDIDGGTYLIGKRFLDKLDDSVKGLQEPGMKKLLTGAYAARGNNVPELVKNMSSTGLSFAPANPGDQAAYQALHDDFVAYANGALAASGFQMRFNAPRTDSYVRK